MAAAFALFVAVAISNGISPDARMEAKLADVLTRYGFERFEPEKLAHPAFDENEYFVSPSLNSLEIDRVLEEIGRECVGCTMSSSPGTVGDGLAHKFETGPRFASISVIGVVDDDRTLYRSSEPGRYSVIIVGRRKDVLVLDRIRSWLPW